MIQKVLISILLLSLLPFSAWAALSANTVWEVRTAGTDTNGGGFVTGASGTDMSLFNNKNLGACSSCQSATVNISTTDAVTAASTTLISATANFSAALIGNVIYLAGGTGTLTGAWYQVTAFTNVTTVTIDRNPGVSTGVTMNIGGALLSPGQASANVSVAGMIVYILNVGTDGASVYSITSASANVAGGVLSPGVASYFQGYTSSRTIGNYDARPTLQLNVSTATLFAGGSTTLYQNLIADGNSQTAAKPLSSGTFVGILFKNFNTTASGSSYALYCSATTNSAAIFVSIAAFCEAYANTSTPFTNGSLYSGCISSGNTGGTTDGFSSAASTPNTLVNCISVSNGRDGFHLTNTGASFIASCHAESNSAFGFTNNSGAKQFINCSAYNNTSGATNFTAPTTGNVGFITVTVGSVFVNAASNNFALNNLTNQGALLRATGFPSLFPRGTTSNYRDIGAAQHQDAPKGSAFVARYTHPRESLRASMFEYEASKQPEPATAFAILGLATLVGVVVVWGKNS